MSDEMTEEAPASSLGNNPIPDFTWTDASLFELQKNTAAFCPSGDWYDFRGHLMTLYAVARNCCWLNPALPEPNMPPRCLEIGTREGPSTLALLTAMKHAGGTLTSIEVDPHAADITAAIVMKAGLAERWTLVVGRSEEVAGSFGELDLIMVDGDHSTEQVRTEVGLYGPKVRVNGWMLFHDYFSDPECIFPPVSPPSPSGVSVVIEEMRATGQWEILVMPWSFGLALARKLRP